MTDLTTSKRARVTAFLKQLDAASADGQFPYPEHDRMNYGALRLHAYRGEKDFALVFEMLMFEHEAQRIQRFHGFCNHAFVYTASGESVAWHDGVLWSPIERVPNGASVSLTEDTAELIENRKERQRLNPAADAIVVRGTTVVVPHDAAAYRARGIEPDDPIALRDVLRFLIADHRDAMFSTDEERQQMMPSLTKLLTLDAWRHFTLDDEAPSRTEAMQMLAEVLVTGDVARYAPTEPPNTSWGDVDARR
jgi:hypothetical protein